MSDRFRDFMAALLGGPETQDVPPPPTPAPPGQLPRLSPEDWKSVANQTRRLDSGDIKNSLSRYGNAINPDNLRVGYDSSISDTNVGGWVDTKILPTVMFLSSGDRKYPDSESHEAVHTWQNLRGRNPKQSLPDTYDTEKLPDVPFPNYGRESQAEMGRLNNPKALDYIKSHPAPDLPRGDVNFLDSVRRVYGENSGLGADTDARFGSVGGVKLLKGLEEKDPFAKSRKLIDTD